MSAPAPPLLQRLVDPRAHGPAGRLLRRDPPVGPRWAPVEELPAHAAARGRHNPWP